MDLKKIKKKIEEYDVISFDLFDTLLKRNVNKPSDIYAILEREIGLKGFAQKRANEELRLWEKDRDRYNLEEIYNSLNIGIKNKNTILNRELELESQFIIGNEVIKELFDYCLIRNKKTIITTDTYFDEPFIIQLLEKNNINGYDRLYVSSKYKKDKDSKTIFKQIKNDYSNNKILHLGDSFKSDFINPKTMGISSIRIKEFKNTKYLDEKNFVGLTEKSLYRTINNNCSKIDDEIERIGYEVLGTLVLGFSLWINKKTKEKDNDTILFLARDAQIVKKAYEILFPNTKSKYVYISRKSILPVKLANVESFAEAIDLYSSRSSDTVRDIIDKMGLNKNIIGKEYLDLNIKNSTIKSSSDELSPIINELHKKAIDTKKSFDEYAKKESLFEKNPAIVDIGWHGTIQDCLQVCYPDLIFDGYYLGLDFRNSEDKNKRGFVFGKHGEYRSDMVFGYRGIMETFFSADHGTTKEYRDGKAILETEDHNKKTQLTIKKLHNGAIRMINDVNNNKSLKSLLEDDGISPKSSFNALFTIATNPNKETRNIFRNISFGDTKNKELIGKKSTVFKLKKFVKNFVDSDWKFGLAKDLFPYINCSHLITYIYSKKKGGKR